MVMSGDMDLKRQEKARTYEDSGDSHLGLHSGGLEDIPEESGSSNSRGSVDNQGTIEKVVASRSGPKGSWGYESSSEPDRDSLKSSRAVPSGRQVLSRGKVNPLSERIVLKLITKYSGLI